MIQIRCVVPDPIGQPDLRVYFSRTELTTKNVCARRGDRLRSCERDPVLIATLEIPGVILAMVTPYSIAITKVPTFEWEEIEPSVLRLLSTFNIGEGNLETL